MGVRCIRSLVCLSVVAAPALGGAAEAGAALPPGPRISFLEAEIVTRKGLSTREEAALSSTRFVTVDAEGHDTRPLLGPQLTALGPSVSWSADGSAFAFHAGSSKLTHSETALAYVAAGDGSGAHPVVRTTGARPAVLSPDGQWLAFARTREHHPPLNRKDPASVSKALEHSYSSTTTWIVPTAGGPPRRLSPWGNGRASVPSSFSPDGSTLLVEVDRTGAQPEVDAIELATGARRTLEVQAAEAQYSPDGSEIAFVSYRDGGSVSGLFGIEPTSELYVAEADGAGARRITHTPKLEETAPSWDPSGTRLAYLRAPGGLLGILKTKLVESNVDGSCPVALPMHAPRRKGGQVLTGPPAWVPGPGREAGPLTC